MHDGQRINELDVEGVDVITVINTLEQLYQVDAFLDSCHELLTPNGTLIAAVRTAPEMSITQPPYDGADFTTWTAVEWQRRFQSRFARVDVYAQTLRVPAIDDPGELAVFLKTVQENNEVDETNFGFEAICAQEYQGGLLSVVYVCSNSVKM